MTPKRPRPTRTEFLEKLRQAFSVTGLVGGRITPILNHEKQYEAQVPTRWNGYLHLMDSFQALYLESLERADEAWRTGALPPHATHYPHVLLVHVGLFRRFRATENLFLMGYSFSGYALMRGVYEQAILLGALANRYTDFDRLQGAPYPKSGDDERISRVMRQNRKREEARLLDWMCMKGSGMTDGDRKQLKRLNDMFDDEVHGGRLSSLEGGEWLRGRAALPVRSDPDSKYVWLYFNRTLEAAWLLTRNLCFLQPQPEGFGGEWAHRWAVMDDSLREFLLSVDDMGNRPFAKAIIRWVDSKFAFTPQSVAYHQLNEGKQPA